MPWLIHCLCLWPLFGVIFSLFFPPLSSLSRSYVLDILVVRFLIKCLSFISACGKVSKVVCCVSVSDLFLSLSSGKDSNLYLTPFLLLVRSSRALARWQIHCRRNFTSKVFHSTSRWCCQMLRHVVRFHLTIILLLNFLKLSSQWCRQIRGHVLWYSSEWNILLGILWHCKLKKIMMITLLSWCSYNPVVHCFGSQHWSRILCQCVSAQVQCTIEVFVKMFCYIRLCYVISTL